MFIVNRTKGMICKIFHNYFKIQNNNVTFIQTKKRINNNKLVLKIKYLKLFY